MATGAEWPVIGIVGAGSLGQAYSALLASIGQSVVLLASAASANRLRQAGEVRLIGAVTRTVPVGDPGTPGRVGVTTDPADLVKHVGGVNGKGGASGILFATKGHQLPEAIAEVVATLPPRPSEASSDQAGRGGDWAGDWWVAGVQNGLVKDDLLADAFGSSRTVGAVSILGAGREADGAVRIGGLGMTYLGEFDAPPSVRVADAVARMTEAGIPAEVAPDIRSVLWSKACNAVGIFGVTVLTRLPGPSLWSNPDLVRAFRALIQETDAVARAHGVAVGDYVGFPIRRYLQMTASEHVEYASGLVPGGRSGQIAPGAFPSMAQDLFAGRMMEVEEVFGDVVARAERAGVDVPRTALVCDLLRGLNAQV
ncbi:MAG: hypothetical protein NTX54_12815 [Chloroflexi bacterium]|nr:hypothetical protein [Chloroflexota bacterium]